jgi:YidC/Oxa1 family membrane protein insertase
MDPKRLIIAVVLSIGVLMAWSKLMPPPPPPAKTEPAPAAPKTPGAPAAQLPPPAPGTPPAPGAPAAPAAVQQPEQLVDLPGKDVNFVLSTWGGTLRHARLTEKTFLANENDPNSGHELVTTLEASQAALRTTFPKADFAAPDVWAVSRPAADTVSFVAENDAVRIEKRFRADPTRYRLQLDVVVTNKTERSQDHYLAVHLAGRQDPEKKGGGFFTGGAANLTSMLCFVGDELKREPVEKLGKDPISKDGTVHWIGADEKFFVLAAAPYPDAAPSSRKCQATTQDGQVGEGVVTLAGRSVPARGSTTYSFAVFSGPKIRDDLEAVRPGGTDAQLEKAIDVTLAVLSRPILGLLKFFHGFTHNWGVAIILLTLFIKLITFWPAQKSMLSAKKMQKLGPKLNAIRKKYENDRQRQSVETMNLYKAHGVSPFGGCLPSLIQMPIWIALYSTLNYAVELYKAPFLHIHDLTAMDPFHIGPLPLPITPLLMGGVMFLQMKMSPASPDNQQQAMMQIMMPVMFTAFSLVLPSGLAVYMLTSYLITILQQLYVNYLDKKGSVHV